MAEGPGGVRRGGATRPLAAARHKAYDLPQPIECEQGRWVLWRRIRRRARVVSRTHGECGVGPIREPHDEVWISSLPAPDPCDTLAAAGEHCLGWHGTPLRRGRYEGQSTTSILENGTEQRHQSHSLRGRSRGRRPFPGGARTACSPHVGSFSEGERAATQ